MKNLKIFGLALVAVFAMSAVVASAASAAVEFKAAAAPATLTGAQKAGTSDVFTTDLGAVTCTTITYEGVMAAVTSREIELEPTYGGCTAFGFVKVAIDVNSCKYKFNRNPRSMKLPSTSSARPASRSKLQPPAAPSQSVRKHRQAAVSPTQIWV